MIVCDASAMIRMVLGDSMGRALSDALDFEDRICAPDLFAFEVTNVFWKYAQVEELTLEQAQELLRVALEAVDLYVPAGDLFEEVLPESVRLGHAAYDVFYLVLARRLGATLATCDRRLADVARDCGVRVLLGQELVER